MPAPSTSGDDIKELATPPAIDVVRSDAAGFVGVAEALPCVAPPAEAIETAGDFGGYWSTAPILAGGAPNLLWAAVQGYFANGGRRLHIAAVAPANVSSGGHVAALAALADTDAAILAAPDAHEEACGDSVMPALVAAATVPGSNRFALIDAPQSLTVQEVIRWRDGFDSGFAALYWPWLHAADGTPVPPSGFVAGAMAGWTADRGVWKAPGNLPVAAIAGLATEVGQAQHDLLNAGAINTIRGFPGRGIRIWGSRTLSRDPQWQYISVRRLGSMLEASITRGLAWTVFEAQGAALWAQVRRLVENFLQAQWQRGAFAGRTPAEAYFVRCDSSTMTADDIVAGRLVVMIGFAPLRPAEFMVVRILAAAAST